MTKSSQMSRYLLLSKNEIKELYWNPYYQNNCNNCNNSLRDNIFNLIWEYYSSQNRHYHNINHIVSCHQQLDEYEQAEFKHPAYVRLSIWFHDVVYDTRQNNNEYMSSLLAKTLLFDAANEVELDCIYELILFTKHNRDAQDAYEELISDIDLSILGTFNSEYKKYSESIRLEYGWVPDYMYFTQRLKILEGFYSKDKIYYTGFFSDKYEIQAKINLREEIKDIKKVLGI